MTKPAIIANMKYVSPTRTGKGTGTQGLRRKLCYFQYRDDRNGHIPQEEGVQRWHNRGLGSSYGMIFKNCVEAQSKSVLAWTWVISPSPTLMELVPEDQRRDLVARLTDEVVEAYYEARDLPAPTYSYVIHDRDTKDNQQQLHSHVILTGKVFNDQTGQGVSVSNDSKKGHLRTFDEIANRELALLLDEAIGIEWRQKLEEPTVEATSPELELEPKRKRFKTIQELLGQPAPEAATILPQLDTPTAAQEPPAPEPPRWSGPSLDF